MFAYKVNLSKMATQMSVGAVVVNTVGDVAVQICILKWWPWQWCLVGVLACCRDNTALLDTTLLGGFL